METFLDLVRQEKIKEIAQNTSQITEKELWQKIKKLQPVASFSNAIRRTSGTPLSIIAEVKAKAPSRNNVKQLDPIGIVQDYEAGGASAISVLTDHKHFGGSLQTMEQIHQASDLPLLHKEFIISPYQLLQGRIQGASAALILVYYFQETALRTIVEQSKQIGVEAIVECSLPEELPRALKVNPDILLINNRPIAAIPADSTKAYDQGSVETSVRWWQHWKALREWKTQPRKCLISASCIHSPDDLKSLVKLPYDAVLIGNAAMVAEDRVAFLKSLTNIV